MKGAKISMKSVYHVCRMALFGVVAALMAGCVSTVIRISVVAEIDDTYMGTKAMYDLASYPFDSALADELRLLSVTAFPFACIDLPFEAVLDTVCYPYDKYRKNKNEARLKPLPFIDGGAE